MFVNTSGVKGKFFIYNKSHGLQSVDINLSKFQSNICVKEVIFFCHGLSCGCVDSKVVYLDMNTELTKCIFISRELQEKMTT
jgi:hypothetical protein